MITIEKFNRKFHIYFQKTNPSGQITSNYIDVKLENYIPGEPGCINIPATGDLQLSDIPEFIEAIELADKIASGELKIK